MDRIYNGLQKSPFGVDGLAAFVPPIHEHPAFGGQPPPPKPKSVRIRHGCLFEIKHAVILT
jgi:hypothetical protein